ncbi:type II secretion system protein [Rariglobus hedericola]|uniref:Type II secretion system protein n=1 Tax=Rariglobus hedericola TaxID=2597822 RepID=A0A556QRY8_9BACT|nr:type II secretion system protein [Rariglobus hedericola]TSJ79405.1 type II secretion system protein [Rariglobus hedericola]
MRSPSRPTLSAAGFTLLEIMVVVTMIGLLCAIAVPAYRKLQRRSVNTLTSNELRVASGALEYYVTDKGIWPPDGDGGIPAELIGYLPPPDRWNKPTPIGGSWSWSINTDGAAAALRINNFTALDDQIAAIDQMIDNGDTSSGTLFRSGQSLIYVLQQ